MSELQKMEAPPAYDTTVSPAPAYDQTTSTSGPDPPVKVTTTPAPAASNGTQFTSIWDQQPTSNSASTRQYSGRGYEEEQSVNKVLLVLGLICCTLFGRLAVYYNNQGQQLYASRSYEEGHSAVRKARGLSVLAIIVGPLVLLAVIGGVVAWALSRQATTFRFTG